jgi:hypothetical protein
MAAVCACARGGGCFPVSDRAFLAGVGRGADAGRGPVRWRRRHRGSSRARGKPQRWLLLGSGCRAPAAWAGRCAEPLADHLQAGLQQCGEWAQDGGGHQLYLLQAAAGGRRGEGSGARRVGKLTTRATWLPRPRLVRSCQSSAAAWRLTAAANRRHPPPPRPPRPAGPARAEAAAGRAPAGSGWTPAGSRWRRCTAPPSSRHAMPPPCARQEQRRTAATSTPRRLCIRLSRRCCCVFRKAVTASLLVSHTCVRRLARTAWRPPPARAAAPAARPPPPPPRCEQPACRWAAPASTRRRHCGRSPPAHRRHASVQRATKKGVQSRMVLPLPRVLGPSDPGTRAAGSQSGYHSGYPYSGYHLHNHSRQLHARCGPRVWQPQQQCAALQRVRARLRRLQRLQLRRCHAAAVRGDRGEWALHQTWRADPHQHALSHCLQQPATRAGSRQHNSAAPLPPREPPATHPEIQKTAPRAPRTPADPPPRRPRRQPRRRRPPRRHEKPLRESPRGWCRR